MTTMNDILIRKATESDLPAIEKLLEDLTNAMDNTEGIDIGVALKTCEHLLNDADSNFLVAEIEGTPVGFVHFTIRQTVLHRGPSALIDELVVAEEYQGKWSLAVKCASLFENPMIEEMEGLRNE